MTGAHPSAWDQLETILGQAKDERARDLLVYGHWSDGRHQPCERCDTSIVVLESTRRPDDPVDTWKRWVEVVSGDIRNGVCNVVVRVHDQARCQELRRSGQ